MPCDDDDDGDDDDDDGGGGDDNDDELVFYVSTSYIKTMEGDNRALCNEQSYSLELNSASSNI